MKFLDVIQSRTSPEIPCPGVRISQISLYVNAPPLLEYNSALLIILILL